MTNSRSVAWTEGTSAKLKLLRIGVRSQVRLEADAAEGRPRRSGEDDDVASLQAADLEMDLMAFEIFQAIADLAAFEAEFPSVFCANDADAEIASEFFDLSVHL